MKHALLLAGAWVASAALAQSVLPFEEETLRYAVNWPSGLSLGEAEMHAKRMKQGGGWEFTMQLDAAIPSFSVKDRYHSIASEQLCSLESEKELSHGKRTAQEKTTFHPDTGKAVRQTLNGGKTEFAVPACARDGLTFLYHVRSELARGRIPPPQRVFFGAAYDVRLEYSGRQNLRLAESVVEADRMIFSIKGPASEASFEAFFATDASRRPVLMRVPLQLGAFTMQLVP